jgi:cytochrome c peroxidase
VDKCPWSITAVAIWLLLPLAARAQSDRAGATPLGLDAYYPVPVSNPMTPGGVALGKRLFFDTQLSIDFTLSCASCHQPAHAFSDTVAQSHGVRGQTTSRNAPSLLNRAYGQIFFWDARAALLEETVTQPIRNPRELGLDLIALVERLWQNPSYRSEFQAEYSDGITETNIARSLASYVRSLRAGDSPFDRYMAGDRTAMSPEAIAGLRVFAGKGNCVACHIGATLTDERLHNTGVSVGLDAGRQVVTAVDADRGKFKVPSLRNVALTAPYMHDGSLATLEAVVDFYDRGGGSNPNLDPEIKPLRLTAGDKRSLIAFLKTLTSEPYTAGARQ